MKLTDPLWFPLSVGSSPANLALGLAVLGFLGGAPVFFGSIMPNFVVLPCGLIIAAWFFGLCVLPFSFRRERASDLVVDDEGITVYAGPAAGRQLGWPALAAPDAVQFYDTPATSTEGAAKVLALTSAIEVKSEDPDEGESLAALADSVKTLARGYDESLVPRPPAAVDPRVLSCASCAAPLPLSDGERAHCGFCANETAIPEPLRVALRDAATTATNRQATRQALTELQRWRRARAVNLLLGVALLPLALAWPVMAAFTSEYFQYYDILRWRDVFVLFAATGSLSMGLVLLVQSQVVLRRAFALVAAWFHARPPGQPGWPHGCRVCAAPLAVAADNPLVICSYCRADNVVLGVLLPHTVESASEQRQSLDALLHQRTRARRRWQIGFWLSLVLIFAGGKQVFHTLARVRASTLQRHAPVDRAWKYEPSWVQSLPQHN